LAQEKVTLSGYIRGAEDGEALIGASVYFPELSWQRRKSPWRR